MTAGADGARNLRAQDSLKDVRLLHSAFEQGLLGDTTHEVYPSLSRSSRLRRLYFTLAPAVNYQRRSEQLWQAALATFQDPETRFVFEPGSVKRGEHAYREALTRHGLAAQPNRQTDIWYRISRTLDSSFSGDPQNLFERCNYRVSQVIELVKKRKREFPYISGPKLRNYWLYMVSTFTDVPLKDRESISVVPDTHVTKATRQLGLLSKDHSTEASEVARVWAELLEGTDLAPVDVHGPLWRWSRAGFPALDELKDQLST